MNIILGATGQVGSMIAENLLDAGQPVKAVVRDGEKAEPLRKKGAAVCIADYFDGEAMREALRDGSKLFVLTPENPFREDVMKDAEVILQSYHNAVQSSGILEMVGLSSFGAQRASGTGNLEISHLLEHAFDDLKVGKTYVRPSYYYSNWLGYYDVAKESGILPTFFPARLKVPMISPVDVARFIADILSDRRSTSPLYEISGPAYSAVDIAAAFSESLGREVVAMEIPQEQWRFSLEQNGFSPSGAENLALMIEAVVSGKTRPEGAVEPMSTRFSEYLAQAVAQI